MDKVYLALYKHKRSWLKEPLKALTDAATRYFTKGSYSHCELVIEHIEFTGGSHYEHETIFYCYSSSVQDGGVRCKQIDMSDNSKWDLIPLDVSDEQIKAYFNRTCGKAYDWWGAIGIVLGIKQKRTKYFCSEWCFNAIKNSDDGWRFSPNQLATIFKNGDLCRLHRYDAANKKIELRNGNSADVVYESQYGKLLVVEQTGDELPTVHWHNADGSFYADKPSALDII